MIVNYYCCNNCNQIISSDSPCGFCWSTKRYEWPPDDVRELLGHIAPLNPSASHTRRIGVIFSCIAFERLLEELLFCMAFGELLYDEAAMIVHALLDGYQGRSRMLLLFSKIGYGTFRKEAAELGFSEFPALWDDIVEERNRLVHGHKQRSKENRGVVALEPFIAQGLQLFASLHNRYNSEMTHFKVATDRKHRKENL